MAGIEDIVGRSGHNSLRDKFEHYNTKYIKPFLLREKPMTRETKIFKVFTEINMQDALDHIAQHGHFKKSPSVSREPSLAQVIRSYSTTSLCPSSQGDAGTIVDHKTVLDMQAVDVYYSKKMADDSRIHHILEDAMFKPRKTFVKESQYQVSEVNNHPPFKHKERLQLRRLISQSCRTKPNQNGVIVHNSFDDQKPTKAVSFNKFPIGEPIKETDEEGVNSAPNSPDCENSPVKFTLGPSELKSTEVLQTTPPPTNHSSVFEVFQSSISDNHEKENDTLPPPPWKQNNDENEPITAHVSNAMSDKANNDLQSCHHDNKCIPSTHSVIIPSEYGDELPKSSGLPGSASDSVLPKHWQPIEMQTLPKKRSMVDAEALMDEIAFQHEVSSRVQKWLENSNSDVDPGDQKMEDVEPCDNDIDNDDQYDSDIETSHL
ncbi:hypothetical protein LOTGIDRAFT_237223 [Lottia gigantea]|uniref:Uncharacterized protein n=1 Tax=Lottia gigantea TaxID=225164 RepID=V4B134_LOTGI|nr:hypothetical protein LOTGIDRAFT_237223 [Lottia gigantea]ESO81924.1 hypothetical protein LOTGIDRAFT_237223 [Lottia gigantea]